MLNREQYLHYRLIAENENGEEEILPYGGYTICYLPTEDEGANIGLSKCSLLDNFSKAKGRKIARERASNPEAHENVRYSFNTRKSFEEVNKLALSFIEKDIEVQIARHEYNYSGLVIRVLGHQDSQLAVPY